MHVTVHLRIPKHKSYDRESGYLVLYHSLKFYDIQQEKFLLTLHAGTHQPKLLRKYHTQSLETIWIEAVRF